MSVALGPLPQERLRIRLRGAVQGVGFRPFVYMLATRHGLSGFVLNDDDGVLAEVEGPGPAAFVKALQRERPPLARIDDLEVNLIALSGTSGFVIRDSVGTGNRTRVPPDAPPCRACLDEMSDPASRFHLYPFVTCTDCGPRFTLTRRLPYDRANTAMAAFRMCADCAAEYADPASRRFHAEAIACPACGPRLSHSLTDVAAALRRGSIVALKGIGGFQLMCDAADETAVAALRCRKMRPTKPFAVMVANEASIAQVGTATAAERDLLATTARPIVLVDRNSDLSPLVAPGLRRVGVMLPHAPLHHLLFHAFAGQPEGAAWREEMLPMALVVTSGNADGDPLAVCDLDARLGLAGIADMIVTHDRPILSRADDSVMAMVDGAPATFRRSRGFVPEPIDLGADGPVVLGVGAHLKATICVTRGREAFVSQHLGDLSTVQTVRFYQETARRMLAMLDVTPSLVVCDLHPDYRSTLYAEATGLPILRVQHHAAHVAAIVAEHRLQGATLGVALDGHGRGDDGGAWGGELILLHGARWRRVGHLLPLPLPGGDRAAREPWRMGVAALMALDRGDEAAARFPGFALAGPLGGSLTGDYPGATTTSMGRLFDAAAALLGVCLQQSYEGQAAMQLEAQVRATQCLSAGYVVKGDVLDFRPLLAALLAPGLTASEGAELFHGTVIEGLADWIGRSARRLGRTDIALSGGCMMNRALAEGLADALRNRGLVPWLPRAVPANDGGLSVGQALMGRAYLTERQGLLS